MKKFVLVMVVSFLTLAVIGCRQQEQKKQQPVNYIPAAPPAQLQIDQMTQAAKRAPKNAQGWINLGNALMDAQRFGEAIEAYGKALALEPIAPTEAALHQLGQFLADGREDVGKLTSAVLSVVSGFEGPYGVELLASTHWVATREGATDSHDAASAVRSWTRRKGRIYTDDHVSIAMQHLVTSAALAGVTPESG